MLLLQVKFEIFLALVWVVGSHITYPPIIQGDDSMAHLLYQFAYMRYAKTEQW